MTSDTAAQDPRDGHDGSGTGAGDPAPVGLRERKKAQTREAIVLAALDLFERKGYDATTIEEIAEAADVSPRTFFRYFDSKVEVVMSPKEERGELGPRLTARPENEGPVELVRQVICYELVNGLAEDPTMARQMKILLSTPSLRATTRDHFNEHEAEMAQEFARRLGVGENDLQAHILATVVGNTVWTVATRWVAEDASPERLAEMMEEAFALLAAGIK